MKPVLSKHHQITYDAIFRHPVARNLHWRDIRSMLAEIGEVIDQNNGDFKTRCGGKTVTFHPAGDKTIGDVDVLMSIRHFLTEADMDNSQAVQTGAHLLVVIDHREARIYTTELHGTAPERITPYDPHGFGRALHYNQDDANGQRKPELKSFYEAVAKTLRGAEKILVFGAGTGASSAMQQLLFDLQHNHHDIAERVVGSITVDEHHLTEDQLLAKARDFYSAPAPAAH
jgi:hypothetical protein